MTSALQTSLIVALCALAALRPPRPRHSGPFNVQFALGYLINEQPFLGLWLLLSGTTSLWMTPETTRPMWWIVTALTAVTALILARLALRARSSQPVLSAAFEKAFGPGAAPVYTRPPWWRIVLLPLISWRPDVRRVRNQRYGPASLDVYLSRRTRHTDAPVLVYLHGGSFRIGSKMIGARPLIYRLASQGWVCVSANYRLRGVGYQEQLSDVRVVLAWVHQRFGGGSVFVAGGSAGAHLAATAALSGVDVSGVIAFYGYYGNAGRPGPEPTSPRGYINPDAPPFLIVHGALDTLVLREDAREFASELSAVSQKPVVYAELPGAQHDFDFFHSLRFHWITDAVVRFAELTAVPASIPRIQSV